MLYNDTIAAIATPPGEGGIGIVRLSGSAAFPLLKRIFRPIRPGRWQPFRLRYGHVLTLTNDIIDEALAVFMRGPRSFTAEDVVEISCHGGPLVVRRVLDLLIQLGARQAEAGEFTMRAFINGRIDLAQAEATLDIIQARTMAGLALAQAQLGGWLSNEVRAIRRLLLDPLAYCTVQVDFPEDEVDAEAIEPPIQAALDRLTPLVASSEQGIIFRQGARAALVGVPNVGKSSLLNALLRVDRAIVTEIPGTTRDTLEETANLAGIPVVLTDTAGITETTDRVEQIGINRSRAALAAADLVLLVLDCTRPITAAERELAKLAVGKSLIVALNKIDLLTDPTLAFVPTDLLPTPLALVPISAQHGTGLDHLAQAVAQVLLGHQPTGDTRLVSNQRHRDAMRRALDQLHDAITALRAGVGPDLLAIDLTAAVSALGEITGENMNDDLLNTIFSRFCIGK
jgi:tRNA modification GTPase